MSALWMPTVIEAAVRSTALLGLAAVLAFVLRHRSAALRHLVWTLALAGGLVLPLAGALMPAVPVPAAVAAALSATAQVPTGATPASDGQPAVAADRASPTTGLIRPAPPTAHADLVRIPRRDAGDLQFQPREPAPGSGFRAPGATGRPGGLEPAALSPKPAIGIGALLFVVWLLGAAAFLARSLVGLWGMQRLARHSQAVTRGALLALLHKGCARLDIQRPVRLLVSRRAVIPMTWGWRRPVVLLPAASSDWSTERQTVVLRHELAHVRRADVVTQLIAQVVCAIYWFNPMAWIGAHRLRVERERACDDEVLRMGTRPSVYATHLLEIAGAFRAPALSAPAAVAMAKRSQVEGRLLAILDPTARRAFPRAAAMVAVVLPRALNLAERPFAHVLGLTARVGLCLDARALLRGLRGARGRSQARSGSSARDRRTVGRDRTTRDRRSASGARQRRFSVAHVSVPFCCQPLLGTLRDADQDVREQAAWALGMIKSPDAVEGLVAALRDSDEDTQEQIAWSLGRIGDERAVDGLIAAAELVEGEALEEVIDALGRIGGDRAMEALMGLMDSSDPEIRRRAIEALSHPRWSRGADPNRVP